MFSLPCNLAIILIRPYDIEGGISPKREIGKTFLGHQIARNQHHRKCISSFFTISIHIVRYQRKYSYFRLKKSENQASTMFDQYYRPLPDRNFRKTRYTIFHTNSDSLKMYFVYCCRVRWPRNLALPKLLDINKYCISRPKTPQQTPTNPSVLPRQHNFHV